MHAMSDRTDRLGSTRFVPPHGREAEEVVWRWCCRWCGGGPPDLPAIVAFRVKDESWVRERDGEGGGGSEREKRRRRRRSW
jgi:hypothetical protein